MAEDIDVICSPALSSCKSESASIALSPAGVAATPNPRKLETRLTVIYFLALCSLGTVGKEMLQPAIIFLYTVNKTAFHGNVH